jgi:3-hydroxymyristoyl/3-hydroxydecanoyl-(acyl carrier protein) dehydratase
MQTQLQFVIEPDHPSLVGHFPGQPIIPGVVVLDHTLALLLRDRPGRRVSALQEVKFLAPVLPGDAVTIDIVDMGPDRVIFIGQVEQRTVLRGRAQLDMTAA